MRRVKQTGAGTALGGRWSAYGQGKLIDSNGFIFLANKKS